MRQKEQGAGKWRQSGEALKQTAEPLPQSAKADSSLEREPHLLPVRLTEPPVAEATAKNLPLEGGGSRLRLTEGVVLRLAPLRM